MMLELGMYGEIIELNEIIDAVIPLLKQNFFVIDKSKSSLDYNSFSRLDLTTVQKQMTEKDIDIDDLTAAAKASNPSELIQDTTSSPELIFKCKWLGCCILSRILP